MKGKSQRSKRFVRTSVGEIALLEAGDSSKPAILFVHGIPTSGYLWRDVIRRLGDSFYCVAPDLMGLGDTHVDPRKTPLHMDSQAAMLGELMTELGHQEFSLVCHDQGGAAAQILATKSPQRIACWVITNSVCYANWPVPLIARISLLSRLPLLPRLVARSGVGTWFETSPLSRFRTGVYDPDNLSDEVVREYLRPIQTHQGFARFRAFVQAGAPRYSERVVPALRRFRRPTLILWAADDRYLSPSWAQRLYEDIPGAQRLELVAFCGHFWQEERPDEFVRRMRSFLQENSAASKGPVHK